MMIIEFEDWGQGFLEWLVDDETGKILNCKPHHAATWVGKYVHCPKSLINEHCKYVHYSDTPATHNDHDLHTVKHAIKRIKYT